MTLFDYRIYNGSSTARSGTVTLNGTVNIVGSSTAFTTQFNIGDIIAVNGEERVIATITDATHLAVSTAFTQSASGLTYTGYTLVNIENFTSAPLPPEPDFVPYSKPTDLLDTTQRGLGWSTAVWKWGWVLSATRDELKTLCPANSIVTYIKTKNAARQYVTCRATLIWPQREGFFASRVLDFVLQFRAVTVL